jgi:hemolysin activation/secretion protein
MGFAAGHGKSLLVLGTAVPLGWTAAPAIAGPYPDVPVPSQERLLHSLRPVAPPARPALTTATSEKRNVAAAPDGPRFHLADVRFEGQLLLPEGRIRPLFAKLLGRDVTLAEVLAAARDITTTYRNEGYLLTVAFIPPQEVTSGVVRVQISDGRVGNVAISGKLKPFDRHLLDQARLDVQEGPAFQLSSFRRTLANLNELPGLQVRSVIEPSRLGNGASDITLLTSRKTFSGVLFTDMSGSRSLGRNRLFGQVSAAGWLSGGELSTLTFGTAVAHPGRLKSLGFRHRQQLDLGTAIEFNVSRTAGRPRGELRELDLNTRNIDLAATLIRKVALGRSSAELSLSVDRQSSLVRIVGEPITRDRSVELQVRASLDGSLVGHGVKSVDLQLGRGVGGRQADDISRFGASQTGWSAEFNASGEWPLTQFQLAAAIEGRWASHPQVALREVDFGGSAFGRGTESATVTGERAAALMLEARLWPRRLGRALVQPYVFAEGALVRDLDPEEPLNRRLFSVGVAARASFGGLSADVGLARPWSSEAVSGKLSPFLTVSKSF